MVTCHHLAQKFTLEVYFTEQTGRVRTARVLHPVGVVVPELRDEVGSHVSHDTKADHDVF